MASSHHRRGMWCRRLPRLTLRQSCELRTHSSAAWFAVVSGWLVRPVWLAGEVALDTRVVDQEFAGMTAADLRRLMASAANSW